MKLRNAYEGKGESSPNLLKVGDNKVLVKIKTNLHKNKYIDVDKQSLKLIFKFNQMAM